jgi:molybdenum cofactor synthesis domain-containing protein
VDINLLNKTEIWINNIRLENTNLTLLAEEVADVLGLPKNMVLVVDVRDNHITLDVLQQHINPESVFGKQKELLDRLSKLSGVKIFEDTDIHSAGILGMIGLDEDQAKEVIEKSNEMAVKIQSMLSKRVIVFPTGFEVKRGMIEDTNTPMLKEALESEGFKVTVGQILDDDLDFIAGNIRRAVDYGYGLVLTTGGVGAEDKDKTVEGILKVDPEAATPYIVKFKQGTGRHEKEGVRIGVGQVDQTLIIALPGPNDEVKIGLSVILNALKEGTSKEALAHKLAEALREKLRTKFHHMHEKQMHNHN